MNRLRSFLTVTLPQIRSSVISGAVFVFIQALDETVVALFVSGGPNQTLTRRMFVTLRDEIDPTIAAISTMLTAITLSLVLLMVISRRRGGITFGILSGDFGHEDHGNCSGGERRHDASMDRRAARRNPSE